MNRECAVHGFFEEETGEVCPIAGCGRKLISGPGVWYVDGSGWNGRYSRACVVDPHGRMTIYGWPQASTNNEMEYEALIRALDEAVSGDIIRTDSQLVHGQVTKGWKVEAENLQPLSRQARKRMLEKGVTIAWVPREENIAGHIFERGGC